eukprot:7208163-Prymnesium_polylepis.1
MRYSRVRALLATPASSPGFFAVVEDGGVSVRRAHDLSLCCTMKDAGSAIACAALHDAGGDRYEIYAGLENGRVVAWAVDLRDHLAGGPAGAAEPSRIFGSGRPSMGGGAA